VIRKSENLLLIIAYLNLASVGLCDGLLGVAWLSMRATFGVTLDAVWLPMTAATVGFIVASFNSGRFITRYGFGTVLLSGVLLKTVGILGIALMPNWWGLIAASLLSGIGSGGIDTGTNNYLASNHSAGRMNWLHASYGVGVTIGPLIMTFILSIGQVWRWGYVAAGGVEVALAAAIVLTLAAWPSRPVSTGGETPAAPKGNWDTLRIPAVWLGIVLFFSYTGVEVSSGQWAYALFHEGRGVAESIAGVWVSIYWGSFTVGRFLIGFAADRIKQTVLLRSAMLGSAIGAALIWWNPINAAGFAGLALLGFSLAPVFPTLIFTTADRLGSEHAPNAIGFQMGAASLGTAAVPALAGVLAQRTNLEAIGPFLLAGVVLTIALHEALVISTRRRVMVVPG
jgi:fucose permease